MNKKLFILMAALGLWVSCSETKIDYWDDGDLSFSRVPENLSGTFDYESLLTTSHPRLFIDADGWERIKEARNSDPHVQEACQIIIMRADNYLNAAPLVWVRVDNKRLLAVSSDALSRFTHLAAAYRITGEEKYLQRAEVDLTAVCTFKDWNPSHFLDVGEMSLGVATGYDWLYNDLSEETKALCRKAISTFGFYGSDCGRKQYIAKNNNWNQVCNAGICVAAIAFFEDQPSRYKTYIDAAVESIKCSMAEYGPDGNYAEGYAYWDYGTSFNTVMLQALDKAFGDDAGLSKMPGFDRTGEYVLFMAGPAGAFNYADGGPTLINLGAQWYMADKFNDPSLLRREKVLLESGGYRTFNGMARLFPIQVLPYVMDAPFDVQITNPKKLYHGDGLNPIVIARTTWTSDANEKFVGIKAGRAAESHGHMDVGSFVYDSQGIRWGADPGREDYAICEANISDFWSYTQNSGRWSKVMRVQPEQHNTLTVKGKLHQAEGFANFDEIYDADAGRGASFYMTQVLSNGVESAWRSVKIVDEEYLEVVDRVSVTSALTIRWNWFTPTTPTVVNDHCIRLDYAGKSVWINIESDMPVKIFTEQLKNANIWDTIAGNWHIGFDCDLKAGEAANFRVTVTDTQQ